MGNIIAREGGYVNKGAILLEIDPSIDRAELEGKERNLLNSRLTTERVNAVLAEKEYRETQSVLNSLREELTGLSPLLDYTKEDIHYQSHEV